MLDHPKMKLAEFSYSLRPGTRAMLNNSRLPYLTHKQHPRCPIRQEVHAGEQGPQSGLCEGQSVFVAGNQQPHVGAAPFVHIALGMEEQQANGGEGKKTYSSSVKTRQITSLSFLSSPVRPVVGLQTALAVERARQTRLQVDIALRQRPLGGVQGRSRRLLAGRRISLQREGGGWREREREGERLAPFKPHGSAELALLLYVRTRAGEGQGQGME